MSHGRRCHQPIVVMMAAISRAPPRSALHRGASVEKLPAIATHKPSESTRLTKRKRDASQDYDGSEFVKKQRTQSQVPSQWESNLRTSTGKTAPVSQHTAVKDSVTQTHQPQNQDAVRPSVDRGSNLLTNANALAFRLNAAVTGPTKAVRPDEKRTLRSQDGGSRIKSELALYFANYDDIVSNEPKEAGRIHVQAHPDNPGLLIPTEYLTAATRIHIVDRSANSTISDPLIAAPVKNGLRKAQLSKDSEASFANEFAEQSSSSINRDNLILNDAQRIAFPEIDHNTRAETQDPLSDDVYAKAHRRAERSEKQLRNIEKEKAMHEKAQLERLLDGLKGHDWLKIMGVSGVTDGGKKSWEPKRDYFIEETEALLEKFREWKEEEKRRKAEREEKIYADEEAESETPSRTESSDYSDVDALAARQLHHETATATGRQKRSIKSRLRPLSPPPVEKPFTSFYSKPYLREAALGKHRRGRTRFAFGQPLPNIQERDFDLPDGLLTHDALAASARSKRRARRESKV